MARNTQLPVAVHVLVALALRGPSLNSEQLAWSIGTHPSLVRRILASLNRAGLVVSKTGRAGGVELARDAREISLLDVYRAVDVGAPLRIHTPNPQCPLGAVVGAPLQSILDDAQQAAEEALARQTVHQVAKAALRRIRRPRG